jgi:hypothetical protein
MLGVFAMDAIVMLFVMAPSCGAMSENCIRLVIPGDCNSLESKFPEYPSCLAMGGGYDTDGSACEDPRITRFPGVFAFREVPLIPP